MANAILTGRFIRNTFVEHRRDFIENCQYGKQIDEFLNQQNCQKRPQAKKPIFLGLESEKTLKPGSKFWKFEKYEKDAPKNTVQNGSYTSPNELMRFPNEAKPILVKIQKHSKMQS